MAIKEAQPIPGENLNHHSRILIKLLREVAPELLQHPDFIQMVKYYIVQDLLPRRRAPVAPISPQELKQLLHDLPIRLTPWREDFFLTSVEGMRITLASEKLKNLNQLDHWLQIKRQEAGELLKNRLVIKRFPAAGKPRKKSKKKRDQ